MKKSIGILTILVGLAFSSSAADWPFKKERKSSRKAKTEKCCEIMSEKETVKVCVDKEKACCMKK